jgi:hypothetical protein
LADGLFAGQGTKCGYILLKYKYSCSSTDKGGDVMVSKAFGGCFGNINICLYKNTNWYWSTPAVSKNCSSSQVCSVSDATLSGVCVDATDSTCTKKDLYEVGTSLTTAYDLGSFNDASAAKILNPKVHFKSAKDVDYLKYKVADTSLAYKAKVHVEWSGSSKIRVCAYYDCDKGKCSVPKCQTGSYATYASLKGKLLRGCCQSATSASATGTLSFEPNIANGDKSGTAYVKLSNASAGCHETSVKFAFGEKIVTQCTPNTTCCTSAGNYASKGTKCGKSVANTEYKCSSSKKGGDVLYCQAY